jgi:hypothetical protein
MAGWSGNKGSVLSEIQTSKTSFVNFPFETSEPKLVFPVSKILFSPFPLSHCKQRQRQDSNPWAWDYEASVQPLSYLWWLFTKWHYDTRQKGLISDTQHNDTQHNNALLLCWVSNFIYYYAECHYVECLYAECRYAECCGIYKTAYELFTIINWVGG